MIYEQVHMLNETGAREFGRNLYICYTNWVHMNLGEAYAYGLKNGYTRGTRLREKFEHDIQKGCIRHNII